MRHQTRWENETTNGTAKEAGIYTHEQLVAKHQYFTPRTINEVEAGEAEKELERS